MATKHVVTGDSYQMIDRCMCKIKKQLDCKRGSPLDPKYVAWVLQRLIDNTGYLVLVDKAKADAKGTIVVPKGLSPSKQVAKAKREINLTDLDSDLAVWNFLEMHDERGEVVGRIDVERIKYEVFTWAPSEYKTMEQVRDHFAALPEGPADGNTALFIAWVTRHKPMGHYASIPSKDELLWRDPRSGSLCAPCFYQGGDRRELDLKRVGGKWCDLWTFVAFRAVTSKLFVP